MEQSQTKSAVTWVLCIVLFSFCAVLFAFLFYSCAKSTSNATDAPASGNYSRNICDDAYRETHYDNDNPPYLDFKLKDGCFSGFITMPKAWHAWQGQMLGGDPTDWEAMWAGGVRDPYGPWSAAQINSQTIRNLDMPQMKMRLEGKGTIRFYPTLNDPNTTPLGGSERPANASGKPAAGTEAAVPAEPLPPPKPPHPVEPTSGATTQYSMTVEQCLRNGQMIDCWGLVKNLTDEAFVIVLQDGHAIDDLGNSFNFTYSRGYYRFASNERENLLPNVPVKFFVSFEDPHQKAATLALELRTSTHQHDDDMTFKDVLIQ